jgi:hypothetical protein
MNNNIIIFTSMKLKRTAVCNVFISDEYWWVTRAETDRLALIPFREMYNEARFHMWPGQDNGHSGGLATGLAMLCPRAPLCTYISDQPLRST